MQLRAVSKIPVLLLLHLLSLVPMLKSQAMWYAPGYAAESSKFHNHKCNLVIFGESLSDVDLENSILLGKPYI